MASGRVGMTPKLTVASNSIASEMADVKANLNKAVSIIEKAASVRAEIVVFPELYLQGYCSGESIGKFFELAEPVPGPSTDILIDQAKRHNIYIAMGLAEADQKYAGLIHNSAVFLGPEGIIHVHRKVHLSELAFAPGIKEIHYGFAPGDQFSVFKIRQNWNIGMSICRDTFFPEAARVMTIKGMDLLITLSASPDFSEERSYAINIARTIENDIFHVYSNVVGTQWGGTSFYGGAMIISPKGAILAKGKTREEELISATLEAEEILECRKSHFYLRDRRPSAYQDLSSTNYPHM